MPSQISLRTSPVLSSNTCTTNKIQVGYNKVSRIPAGDGADMKAAARTVGSLLVAHKSIRKPHNMNLNGSCGRTVNSGAPSKCFSLPNGNGTVNTNFEREHHALEHMNGMLDTPPLDTPPLTAHPPLSSAGPNSHCSPPESKGQHSNNQSSLTAISNEGRLMCPDLAVSYTGTLIGKRAGCLANKQKDLEQRVALLQRKVRLRQLHMVHSHACRQLDFDGSINDEDSSNMEEGSGSSLTDSDFSMEISPPQESELGVVDLPIQVDGASGDTFSPPPPEELRMDDEEGGPSKKRNEDSFSSLDSCVSSMCLSEEEEDDGGDTDALMAQLASLETLLDGDLTEVSSDEEGEVSADLHYR